MADRRAYTKTWRALHLEQERARAHAYYISHLAERKAYYATHREERAAGQKRFKAANRERLAAKQRARQAAMPPIVYIWMAPDGQADYVGRGTKYRARTHSRHASWWTLEHTLLTMSCETEWQAMEIEGRWGALYQPRHNKEGYRHAKSEE